MITFAIAHYYRENDLKSLISNLIPNITNDDEILIWNNGSCENLIIYYEKEIKVRVVNSEKNLGVVQSRKNLLSIAKNKKICFLDDDIVLKYDFVRRLKEKALLKVDIIAFKVVNAKNEIRPFEFLSNSKFDKEVRNFLGGACLFNSEKAIFSYQEVNESFYGMEEHEAALILWKKCGIIHFCPTLEVIHLRSELTIETPAVRFIDNFDKISKKIVIIWKYYPTFFALLASFAWTLKALRNRKNKLSYIQFLKHILKGGNWYK